MNNLWLKELELTNWQKHSSLKIQFNEGVNVLAGPSDAGKSCIRRAISFLFFNEPHGEHIRKIGTKQTSVRGVLSNGWEVTRIKSASINRIILRKDDVEKVFDAVGATTPEEVQKVLEVRELEIDKEKINLNIAKQLTLPFLYDKPATFRAKIFSMLTGNDLIDKIVQTFNKELLSISKDLKVEGEFVTNNEPQLLQLKEQIDNKKCVYTSLRDKLEQIKCNYKKLNELQQIDDKLLAIQEQVIICKEDLKKYSKSIDSNKLEEIKKKNERLTTLKNTLQSLRTNKVAKEAVDGALKELRISDVKLIEQSRVKIEVLSRLKESFKHLGENKRNLEENTTNLNKYIDNIYNLTNKYRELVKQAPICKECKQIIKPECIVKEI